MFKIRYILPILLFAQIFADEAKSARVKLVGKDKVQAIRINGQDYKTGASGIVAWIKDIFEDGNFYVIALKEKDGNWSFTIEGLTHKQKGLINIVPVQISLGKNPSKVTLIAEPGSIEAKIESSTKEKTENFYSIVQK